MKKYFLSYNETTKDYCLDYGCFDRNREVLKNMDREKLIKKLKEILPMQRKIMLYSEKKFDDSLKIILEEGFKGTSVKVQFEKNLESIC